MELTEQQECSVSGALSFVLRVAKFYGVAFCDFHRTDEGLRIRTSRCTGYYGKMIVLICIALSTASLVLDFRVDKEISLHSRSNSDITVNAGSLSIISVVLLVEAYSGIKRMQVTITCLARIEKIIEDLNKYGPPESFKKTKRNLAIWSLLGGHIVVMLDAAILIFEIIDKDTNVIFESMYIAYYAAMIILKVLILQITLIFTTVLAAFYHLNNCLKLLQQQVNDQLLVTKTLTKSKLDHQNIPNKMINNAIDSIATYKGYKSTQNNNTTYTNFPFVNKASSTIHNLGVLYHSLCEVVYKMNAHHGVFFVTILLYFLLHLVITPYLLISRIFGDRADFYIALIQFMWAAYHITDMLMVVEPCHRTHEQVNETKQLISQLLRNTPPEHFNFIFELDVFYKRLVSNDIYYTPMNMFSLNRSVVATILGSITTYLVVIIQE